MSTSREQAVRNLAAGPETEGRRIVAWSDPPPDAGRRERTVSHYQSVVRELVTRPGRWAQLDDRNSEDAAYQFALSISNGRTSGFRPAGAFEAAWHGRTVWVRYVGEEPPAPLPVNVVPAEDDDWNDARLPRFVRSSEPVVAPDTKGVFAL